MNIRKLTPRDAYIVHELELRSYPENLCEDPSTIEEIICSSKFSLAAEADSIIGYLLVQGEKAPDRLVENGLYLYDLNIAAPYRKSPACAKLLDTFFSAAYAAGKDVAFHCRSTSLPIIRENRIGNWKYRIVQREELPDFYKQWGVDEGAIFFLLKPQ